MTMTIEAIYRYPVKGLSAEPLGRVGLAPGECLPHDRRFAIALPTTRFDPKRPEWLAKTHFIMLMRDARLAELETRYDDDTGFLTVANSGDILLRAQLTEPADRRRVGAFFAEFLSGTADPPFTLVDAPGHAFADAQRKPNATTGKYVSLINRASIEALEAAVGAPVDPLRFRANIYFSGVPAWAELDWFGREIAAGSARLRVIAAITRCAATAVNPMTAQRDIDVVGLLQRHFGRNLMGVYAEVVTAGEVGVGDRLTVEG